MGLSRLTSRLFERGALLDLLFDLRYPFEVPPVKVYEMLLKWKAAKGSDATFQVLHDALCHRSVNRRDLAQKYCLVNL